MSPRVTAYPAARRVRGVGVIEVLIALVVVSLGVLGVAGLQLTGMQHSSGGFSRSKALLHAEDMAGRMRLNRGAFGRAGGTVFDYDGHDSSAPGYCAAFGGPVCDARDGIAAEVCDAGELAAFDLFTVSCGVVGSDGASGGSGGVAGPDLPGGALTVDCEAPCALDSTWTVTVSWSEGNAVTEDQALVDDRRVMLRLRP